MDKKLLIKKIKNLSKKYYKIPYGQKSHIFKKIKNLIDEYLTKNPADIDVRLRLVMLEYTLGWEDPELLGKYLNEIFKYDPDNIYAALILAYTQYLFLADVTDAIFEKLNNLSSKDPEILSMVELAKAWYYQCKDDDELYEKHLLNSIRYCNKHVSNYTDLAHLYTKKGEKNKVKKFAQKAIDNIRVLYTKDYPRTDVTDVEKFINEFFKGTHITEPNLESIYELLK